MFNKVLIANRGEIAVRIIRSCREMGITTVAVYSEADRKALHVCLADEAYCIGPPPSSESYLRGDRLIKTARASGADAIHPGYGFLAENADFARRCEEAGIKFIGPSSAAIRAMGDKTIARQTIQEANVPVVPGTHAGLVDASEAIGVAAEIGYPVLLKAALGGGGKGMRVIRQEQELASAFRTAQAEAQAAFGDSTLYLEKYLEGPRHVEIQVLGDEYGHLIHLGERECSIQRRHQKVIEESPCCALNDAMRQVMGEAAVRVAAAVGYYNAGTVEFLLDRQGNFYFLEMNTRLQVEHPVTEMRLGLDLVKAQLQIATGDPLTLQQDDLKPQGTTIECRIGAEDPANDFLPSGGLIEWLREPAGPYVRLDSGIYQGYEVPLVYDPLLSKLIVWGRHRTEAIQRMVRALEEYELHPIKTTIPFHLEILHHPVFLEGTYNTHFIATHYQPQIKSSDSEQAQAAALAVALLAYRKHRTPALPALTLNRHTALLSPWKLAGRQSGLRR